MLACNLYLLQLPHSDSLPMHYARHVAPDILALFRLANRRKYVLPTDVSMNSTTAIQELYRDNDHHNNKNNNDKYGNGRDGSSSNDQPPMHKSLVG